MPFLVVKHDGTAFGESFQIGNNIVGLFCHAFVEIFPGFIVLVDLSGFLQCCREVLFREQVYGLFPVLDTSGRIDAWSDLKNNITDGNFLLGKSAYVDDGFHANAGITVQLFQTVIGENTVFTHDGDNVRCNTHRYKVEQRNQVMKLNTVVDCKCLHKLKTDSTAGKVCVWISVVQTFGIQNSDGRGEDIVWYMMVADDKVDSLFFRIRDFLYCFYAAVEYDNQSYAGFRGVVDSLFRNAIPFVVAVGYVIVNVRIELLNELVDQCYGSSTVYVIISINQNTLFLSHRPVQTLHCNIHILHQERIVQVGQLRAEKLLGICCLRYSPLHQKLSKYRANA